MLHTNTHLPAAFSLCPIVGGLTLLYGLFHRLRLFWALFTGSFAALLTAMVLFLIWAVISGVQSLSE
jgi:hypothetical protein